MREQDKRWVLEEAANPGGFTPHTLGAAALAMSLESEGLLLKSSRGPVWAITEHGRAAIAELEIATRATPLPDNHIISETNPSK